MGIARWDPNGFKIRLRSPSKSLHELTSCRCRASPVATGLHTEGSGLDSLSESQRPRSPVAGGDLDNLIAADALSAGAHISEHSGREQQFCGEYVEQRLSGGT